MFELNSVASGQIRQIAEHARDRYGTDETERIMAIAGEFIEHGGTLRPSCHDYQRPEIHLDGFEAKPWYNPDAIAAARILKDSYCDIRLELMSFLDADFNGGCGVAESKELVRRGDWSTLPLIQGAERSAIAADLCPRTLASVSNLPGLGDLAFVSVLHPKSHVDPHCGPWNLRINLHLGISIPSGCGIRVAGENRNWSEGECLAFDDSFEHEVWNVSDEHRLVLVVCMWHPSLTHIECETLIRISDCIMHHEQIQ